MSVAEAEWPGVAEVGVSPAERHSFEPASLAQDRSNEEGNGGVDDNLRARSQSFAILEEASGGCGPSMFIHECRLVGSAGQTGEISHRFLGDLSILVWKAPQQKERVFRFSCSSMYPTDQVARQKGEKKFREAKLAEEGLIAAEIKAGRKRKTFMQDDHKVDRGSDLGFLEEVVWIMALVAEGNPGVAITYFVGHEHDCCSGSAESCEDEMEKVFNCNFSFHYLVVSSGVSHRIRVPGGRGGGGLPCADRKDRWISFPVWVGWFS